MTPRWLVVLGLPTFGMALAITAVSTYVPVLARQFDASTVAIGLIVGAEGMLALWLPVLVGARSDRLRTRLGGRLPFVLAGTPLMAGALLAIGLVGSVLALAACVAVFFAAYFLAYEPYRALYPDLVPDDLAGRSQSVQAGWRGLGTLLALASGGALLAIADFLAFATYALLLALSVGVFVLFLLRGDYRDRIPDPDGATPPPRQALRHVTGLLRDDAALRSYFLANSLWELSLAALKAFVVLYVTVGLGYSLGSASLLIGAVAVLVLAGALAGGFLGDRYGRPRVFEIALWAYGLPLLVPALTTARPALLAAVPLIAFGGGVVMSLPYSLLMPLMPRAEHGVLTGLYGVSRGIGVSLGPLLAGLAIELGAPLLDPTEGYGAVWLICSAAILLSIPLLRAMRASAGDRNGE